MYNSDGQRQTDRQVCSVFANWLRNPKKPWPALPYIAVNLWGCLWSFIAFQLIRGIFKFNSLIIYLIFFYID